MNTNKREWSREYALKVLGLPVNADMDMVKKAYHQLCKKFHPDENRDYYALDSYLLIQEAYEYLETVGLYQYVYPVNTPFMTSTVAPPQAKPTRIIGTGTYPEREKKFEEIRRSKLEKEARDKKEQERIRKEKENRRLQEERSRQILEAKRKREVESQLYRIMEALRMLDEKRNLTIPKPEDETGGFRTESEKRAEANEVYARKRAYEAFRKYEERNQENDEKRIVDPFVSFQNESVNTNI